MQHCTFQMSGFSTSQGTLFHFGGDRKAFQRQFLQRQVFGQIEAVEKLFQHIVQILRCLGWKSMWGKEKDFWKQTIWVFPKIGVPQNGWFRMGHPIKMDDLGVPQFLETPIYLQELAADAPQNNYIRGTRIFTIFNFSQATSVQSKIHPKTKLRKTSEHPQFSKFSQKIKMSI